MKINTKSLITITIVISLMLQGCMMVGRKAYERMNDDNNDQTQQPTQQNQAF